MTDSIEDTDTDDDEPRGAVHEKRQDFFITYNEFVDHWAAALDHLEISVYMVLCRFASPSGKAFPSYSTISILLGAKRQRVMEALQKLKEKGIISIKSRTRKNGGRSSNMYVLTDLKKKRLKQQAGGVVPLRYQGNTGGGTLKDTGGGTLKDRSSEKDQLKKTNTVPAENPTGTPCVPFQKQTTQKRKRHIPSGNKDNAFTPPFKQGFDIDGNNKPPEPPKYPEVAAQRLFDAVSRAGKFDKAVSKPQLWPGHIRKYLVASERTLEEFDVELSWYCDHIGEEWIPEAYCANSFCEKFVKIRKRREDLENKQNGHSNSAPTSPPVEMPKIRISSKTYTQEELLAIARNS